MTATSGDLVALHTQALGASAAGPYLDLLDAAVKAARLNAGFPDRKGMSDTFRALNPRTHGGVYDAIFVDARTGLPNMASVVRARTDHELARDNLTRLGDKRTLEARRSEAPVFEEMLRKHAYYEQLVDLAPMRIDERAVVIRRHDPATGTASFRIEVTKLDASGLWIRAMVELAQTSSRWRRKVVDLAADGETAKASEELHSLVYRHAGYEAETLFLQLAELEGVVVERVARGVVGPVLFAVPFASDSGVSLARPLELPDDTLGRAWQAWLEGHATFARAELLAGFQTDTAAIDVKNEKSNDPCARLLSAGITDTERPRYEAARAKAGYRVYKDRKFVTTPGTKALAQSICEAAGTKNLIYDVR